MSIQETGLACVAFSAEETIRTVADAYEKTWNAVRQNDTIMLDVSEVTDIDLTFVQLLVSAQKTANAMGKRVSVTGAISEAFRDVLKRGGFAVDDAFWGCAEVV